MLLFHYLFTLLLYLMGILVLGFSLYPSLIFLHEVWIYASAFHFGLRLFIFSFAIVTAYFLFGIVLIFSVGIFRFIFRLNLKEGEYSIKDPMFLRWMLYSAMIIGVRKVFLDLMHLTPLITVYYRLMGAKVGEHVQVNSNNVGDMCLLEIGDGAVIGGHATVIGHSFESKGLKLQKVKIGKRAIIGLNAIVLPGCEIGDNAVVAAGAILPKGTKVSANTIYFGVKSSTNEKQ